MRLTPLAKIFIALVLIAVVGYVLKYKVLPTSGPASPGVVTPEPAAGRAAGEGPASRAKRIVIGINDFGGGYPLLLANDGAMPGPGSLFRKAGLEVEVRLIRGSKERLRAFEDGEVHVMLLTLDYLANLAPIFKQKGVDLRSFLLVDWSRGNIGIAAKPQFSSIESLKTARIATTRNTPTHYLLLSLLEKSNLTPSEIDKVKGNLVFATKTPQAGELFRQGEVDAVAIWEPHLSEAIADGKGVTLVTTETATNLVADVLFARKDWLEEHKAELAPLAQAYFTAVEQLGRDPARAIELSAAAFQQKPEQIAATLKKTKPATFADNRAFFGMATEDCAYDSLYLEASRFWQKEGLIKEIIEPARTKWLAPLETLAPQYRDQKVVENFQFTAAPSAAAPSLLTKSVSIYFASGQSAVDPNARKVLDGFAETLAVFQNAFVQVEGNTDNVGNRVQNIALSKARAESVIGYLVERHRLNRERFIAIGNGPDHAVADNKTPEGRELNRRTDFRIIKNSGTGTAAENVRAAATDAKPEVTGGTLAPAALLGGIKQNIAAFRACYTAALKSQPGLRGRVVLRMTVDATGAVSDSDVESSTLGSPAAEKCLTLVARRIKFPRPTGAPVRVTYPLAFQPDDPQ
ncbi:MAG TPA: TonB family protein [Pseudomonadota bacterium]|nr:TonB family protein [Pseudomonadota bacterium]